MLTCSMCPNTILGEKIQDAPYTAFGEPICSRRCYLDAYALDRQFEPEELPRLNGLRLDLE